MFSNAQLYLGGSLGFNSSSSKSGSTETTSSSITFAPELGYSLTDRFDIGGAISITSSDNGSSVTSGWSLEPYARLAVLKMGNFSVLGKAYIKLAGSKTKSNSDSKITAESTTLAIGVLPMFTYRVSEHFLLLTELSFFRLGLSSTINDLTDSSSTSINFAANSNLFTTGDVKVGFAYIF